MKSIRRISGGGSRVSRVVTRGKRERVGGGGIGGEDIGRRKGCVGA